MPRDMSHLNAWREHLKNVREQNPGLSLKEAMVKAKESYKKKAPAKKPIKGGIDASAVIEGIKKGAEEISGIATSVFDSVNRKARWDQIVEILNAQLQRKKSKRDGRNFEGLFDPRVAREFVDFIADDDEQSGGGIVQDIAQQATTNETKRALSIITPALIILNKKLSYLSKALRISPEDLFPGVDLSNYDL